MTPIRTLLVEDDEPHARLIVERLRDTLDVDVVATCPTLGVAIEEIGRRGPHGVDAALLDLGLPDSEGVESVRAVRIAAPRLPIVVLSGHGDVALAVEAMRHGAQDYVLKSAGGAENIARALHLARERKRLQDVEQLLVGVVSHDLRAPLQTILLGAEMLLREHPGAKHAATVKRAALRATALVDDLLDAARMRLSSVLPIDVTEVDLTALVGQVVEDAKVANPDRIIAATLDAVGPSRGDPKRLMQVTQNLLGNALQHSPKDSPVSVALRRRGEAIEVAFHNSGKPIAPALRATIFEPLQRAPSQLTRSHSVGLGLYIVSEIVRAHGGTITVRSDAEAGTDFVVRLP